MARMWRTCFQGLAESTLSTELSGTLTYNPASQVIAAMQQDPAYVWNTRPRLESQTHNGLNQISTIATRSIGYDGRGNLTSDGAPRRWPPTPGVSFISRRRRR